MSTVVKRNIFDFYNLSENEYEAVKLEANTLIVRHKKTGKTFNLRY